MVSEASEVFWVDSMGCFPFFNVFWFLFFGGFDVVFCYFWLECCLLFQDLGVLEKCQTKSSMAAFWRTEASSRSYFIRKRSL